MLAGRWLLALATGGPGILMAHFSARYVILYLLVCDVNVM